MYSKSTVHFIDSRAEEGLEQVGNCSVDKIGHFAVLGINLGLRLLEYGGVWAAHQQSGLKVYQC